MNITKLTKRSLALGSASAVAIAMAGSAQAATSTTPTNLVYTDVGGLCQIEATFTITGEDSDNPNNTDEFQVRITDGLVDARLDIGTTDVILVGSSAVRSYAANIRGATAADARTAPIYYSVIDNVTALGGTQYITIAQTPIDPAAMRAAGGECATAANAIPGQMNQAPIANAGPDAAGRGGRLAGLSAANSSDPDGDTLTFSWTQTNGTPVVLNNPDTDSPTFTTPPAQRSTQTLTFEVTVTDPSGASSTDQVNYTVLSNAAPQPDAGADQTVQGGDTVTLDASSSSDPNNDQLTYSWSQSSGPNVTLSDPASAMPTFTAPAATGAEQVLVFNLTVSDGVANPPNSVVQIDQVTIRIAAATNLAPIADAGTGGTITAGQTVTLDGTGSSDPEGDAISYTWTQVSGTNVTINSPNSATASFVAPARTAQDQRLVFQLEVQESLTRLANGKRDKQAALPVVGVSPSNIDTVEFIIPANDVPIADAGANQGPLDSGTAVQLDGSGSSDADGDPLTYSWTQVSGTPVTLTGSNTATPSFTAPLVAGTEDLVFRLVVNDGFADSPADTVRIAIRAQGTITIVQRVVGDDTTVAYTTTVPGLASTITTSGGQGSASVSQVTAGSYSFSVDDLRAQGYALTALDCNDTDSAVSLANSSIGIELSPSEDLVCTVELSDTRSAATQAIGEFLGGRNALLMGAEPSRQRRIDRLRGSAPQGGQATVGGMPVPGGDKLPMQVGIDGDKAVVRGSLAMTRNTLGMGGAAEGKFDIWFEGQVADVTLGRNKGTFKAGFIGADYVVSENLLVGALFQIDDFDNDDDTLGAGEAQGSGWMAGPYLTARFDEQFYVDARVAYGKSSNSVSPLGTFVSDFDTTRLFATLSASGDVALGEGFTLWPEASVRYLREGVNGYTDTLGVRIDDFNVDQGEVAFSPRIDYLSESADGWTTAPYAKMEGVLTFGANAFSPVDNGLRGKTAVGIDVRSPDDVRFGLSGFYDGIGEDDYKALGASVTVGFSF
ncbi:autotransporter domain-containing protein [Qipengyuania aurantiaca]|uniref:Autotransporter domain-containing protein n=1 Tax=Qipengyuania aurantiaca TaxID=2867233 RepID=A0ABX8ZPN0_9SPHN|nr:autotransporter outer membrane beta-barrel domain-containing protein [Qipengyuania aurantiaca]QZD90975.1 autotransporter domain-containing protein [Qipengyuania aurantiaca]